MTYNNFTVAKDADGIALVTWDMPGKSMNVIDTSVVEEFTKIVDEMAADASVKGVVVTSGKETFSGGADLSMLEMSFATFQKMKKTDPEGAAKFLFEQSSRLQWVYRKLETCGKPWVAAINGTCMGGAFEMYAGLPRPRHDLRPEGQGRPARSQGRPVPRRRRHPARAAPDQYPGSLADAVAGQDL